MMRGSLGLEEVIPIHAAAALSVRSENAQLIVEMNTLRAENRLDNR